MECHGPSFIVQAFNVINKDESTSPAKAWKELQVYRDGFLVDTLHNLRNNYQLWEDERKAWVHRVGGGLSPRYPGAEARALRLGEDCKWSTMALLGRLCALGWPAKRVFILWSIRVCGLLVGGEIAKSNTVLIFSHLHVANRYTFLA